MLNRRILRIKAFKVLYSSSLSGNVSLTDAEKELDASCEAVRDLYIMMLGIIPPLTAVARERLESAKRKFNPTEEERNPNTRFVDNSLAVMFAQDPDFSKAFARRKFSWDQYDLFLKKVWASISSSDYYRKYMASETSSVAEDCRLFTRIFEREFVDSEDLAKIMEDLSIYWNDDLAYALTWCCRSLETIAKGGRWSLPPLYQSEMNLKDRVEDDRKFVHKLLQNAFASREKYTASVVEALANWEQERLVSTDMALIILGLAEAATFPAIPLKVTINEYVEISKYYGTPKSSTFVNGILDRTIQKMIKDGTIVKNDYI